MGCTADVFSVYSPSFNAYYDRSDHTIVLLGLDKLPLDWQRLIVAHEAAHCLQFQAGEANDIRARGPYELERDADRVAIQVLADKYGIDGANLNQEIWATLYRDFGFNGDAYDSHGLSTHRIARGWLNRLIHKVEAL